MPMEEEPASPPPVAFGSTASRKRALGAAPRNPPVLSAGNEPNQKRRRGIGQQTPLNLQAVLRQSLRDDYCLERLLARNSDNTSIVRVMRPATTVAGSEELVVVKSFKTEKQAHLIGELEAMRRLGSHSNIICMQTCFTDAASPGWEHLVLDYQIRGDLCNALSTGPLDCATSKELFRGICKGLAHMHTHNIVHQDISLENVLITATGCAVLADFGLAALHGSKLTCSNGMGKDAYMSPEMVRGQYSTVDFGTDIWSSGIVLFSMLAGTFPFAKAHSADKAFSLVADDRLVTLLRLYKVHGNFAALELDLVRKMLQVDPASRIKLAAVIGHRFLQRHNASEGLCVQ